MTRNLDGAQKTPGRLLPQHGTDGLLARCIGPVMADSRHDLQRLRPMTKDRAAQFKMRALAQRHVQRHAAQRPTHVEDVEIHASAVFDFDDIIPNRDCIFTRPLDPVAPRPFSRARNTLVWGKRGSVMCGLWGGGLGTGVQTCPLPSSWRTVVTISSV